MLFNFVLKKMVRSMYRNLEMDLVETNKLLTYTRVVTNEIFAKVKKLEFISVILIVYIDAGL